MKFRTLKADEIECRVATVSEKGCSLLLYKDSRADMNLLDETVGPMNWQRTHERDNANCIVSIWDEKKGQWISKEDTGTESYTEKEKGLASDSFKRACFNWGIGRELYTAPFIWVRNGDVSIVDSKSKKTTRDRFKVKEISYIDGKISGLVITNTSLKRDVFILRANADKQNTEKQISEMNETEMNDASNKIAEQKIDATKIAVIKKELKRTGLPEHVVLERLKVSSLEDVTEHLFTIAMKIFEITKSKGVAV